MKNLHLMSLEHIREFARQEKLRLSRLVYVQDGYIIINSGDKHDIDLNSCNTHALLVGWVLFLTEKAWATNEIIGRFIELAIEHNGLERPVL